MGCVMYSMRHAEALRYCIYMFTNSPLCSCSRNKKYILLYTVGAGLSGAGSGTVAVLEGDSATLVCGTDLTGNPIPSVSWRDNNDRSVWAGLS